MTGPIHSSTRAHASLRRTTTNTRHVPAGVAALARLNVYKGANATDVAYYRRVIREAPERALDLLLYKDMLHHEASMRLVAKQLHAVRKFYNAQPAEIKRRIDQRLADVDAYYRDKAFVDAVHNEMGRQVRTESPKSPRPGISPG